MKSSALVAKRETQVDDFKTLAGTHGGSWGVPNSAAANQSPVGPGLEPAPPFHVPEFQPDYLDRSWPKAAEIEAHPKLMGEGLQVVAVLTYDASLDRFGLIVTESGHTGATVNPCNRNLDEEELRVLRMLANGACSKHIARSMETSVSLAGRRAREAVKKMGTPSRAAAIAHAVKAGLLEPVA